MQRVTDPSRDSEFPYNRKYERRVLRDAEAVSTYEVAYWESKDDDFNPDVNVRLYVPLAKISYGNGDGAIYTPEYLRRRRGC